MTPCNKPVTRKSELSIIRDGGKVRALVVTIYPSGVLGLRPLGTRREEFIPATACWSTAVKMRVAAERREKASKKERTK